MINKANHLIDFLRRHAVVAASKEAEVRQEKIRYSLRFEKEKTENLKRGKSSLKKNFYMCTDHVPTAVHRELRPLS